MRKGKSNKMDTANHKFIDGSSALVFVSLVLVAVLTYLAFILFNRHGLPADLLVSEEALKKSDWLGFWGCLLGVISTVVFSSLSWKQNKILNNINDNREKKDTFFAKMRFAAEFYSLIDIDSFSLWMNEDSTSLITMELTDTGKTPPSFIKIEKFVVKPTEEIEKRIKVKVESIDGGLIHNRRADVESRDNHRSNNNDTRRKMIRLKFDLEQTNKFRELYKVVYQASIYNNDIHFFEEPCISLALDYIIENALKVQTSVKTILTLKATMENISVEEDPDVYRFSIFNKTIESVDYTFVGEIQ